MKLYKVLRKLNNRLLSPFKDFEYILSKYYCCHNFDTDVRRSCSHGYYATDIDGIIYTFRNLPGYEVWEVEVSGKRVEIDQFKRRYEYIKLLRQISREEIKKLALAEEARLGYKLAEALFPVDPLKIEAGPVTDEELKLLKKWISVRDSVVYSVWNSVRDSAWSSVVDSVTGSVKSSVVDSVWGSVVGSVVDSAWGSVRDSAWDSVWGSVWGYISSLFPGIEKWKYINCPKGENPFQPCIDLWRKGFVPVYDGTKWMLYTGKGIAWEEAIAGRENPHIGDF